MHYLNEGNILLFLIQLFVILSLSKFFGILLKRIKQPTVTSDILIGVFLGPTILGRVFPAFQLKLFPIDAIQQNMIETVGWLGLFLLLMTTGLEINFSSVWKQKKDALKISLSDIIIPIMVSVFPILLLPDKYLIMPENRITFSFFVATIMTISAMPVAIRGLHDLNILKSDTGFLIVSALTINDVIGWIIFTIILSIFTQESLQIDKIAYIIIFTLLFVYMALFHVKKLLNAFLFKISEQRLETTAEALSVVILLGIAFGIITMKIGIHSLFGFFIAGILAGESKYFSQKSRTSIEQIVYAIFAPIFFVNIGLKIDFLANFDIFLAFLITAIGIFGRFLGAWVGSFFSKKSKIDKLIISVAHVPGGEMHIVVSLLALEYGLISKEIFIAIVFGAIFSSIIMGPWLAFLIKKSKNISLKEFLSKKLIIQDLDAITPSEAIEKISALISANKKIEYEVIKTQVLSRENMSNTSIEEGIALPHARLEIIDKPVIAFAFSKEGIYWNSPDGKKTKFIFLILTPKNDNIIQLKIIRELITLIKNKEVQNNISAQRTGDSIYKILIKNS
ncbi:cation:proton antiporter [uncultured Ilyobacter sp.]|uniref:cation:proton antiporter domain-containing protein n=1 Tax=uncultured Ilyobacter sp. TaxID=544433 RepID=UPI0029C08205|nr:cation:proton antiporter [uncultured Ilyobacter sp.]